ncbi:hypothetical protein IWW34DRAFT_15900 [Fusarium oxysporum f. sp. albedinis]|nr:hypothetical protein IWW34DRAFT_15900 [Fusarium oxysporum f. sp. albedinis]
MLMWVVVFIQKRRNASAIVGSSVATGFWGGMTIGRLFLSSITDRSGKLWAMSLYIGVTIALELVFWLVPNLVVSAVAAALIGVAMGQCTPLQLFSSRRLRLALFMLGLLGLLLLLVALMAQFCPLLLARLRKERGYRHFSPLSSLLVLCLAVCGCYCPASRWRSIRQKVMIALVRVANLEWWNDVKG